jgi:hypothetical protein
MSSREIPFGFVHCRLFPAGKTAARKDLSGGTKTSIFADLQGSSVTFQRITAVTFTSIP